jgi:hypothetical protein
MTTKKTPEPKAKAAKTAAPRRPRIEYAPALAEQVLDLIIDGRTLKEIEAMPGMPSRSMILKWKREHEDFAALYDGAMDLRADGIVDDIEGITRGMIAGTINSGDGREIVKSLQWIAGARAPRRYGQKERSEVNVNTDQSNHIHLSVSETNEWIERMLAGGAARALPKPVSN